MIPQGFYIPSVIQNWHLERAKVPGLNDRKQPHISNIRQFAIDSTAGAFAQLENANFESRLVFSLLL